MDRSVIDHRSPEFSSLTAEILPQLRTVFGTHESAIVVYPASGTGAWEASLVNILSPGDRVLSFDCGYFSAGFGAAARNLGFEVDEVHLRWGQAIPPAEVEVRLRADGGPNPYKAVLVVHNETSTGVMSDIDAIRLAIDATGHDALLIVDAVSSFASVPFAFDKWRVDVALSGSQKGLMLPPGLAVLCVSERAKAAAERGGSARHFWDWRPILRDNELGFYPYTPATQMLFGLREALRMLVNEEGLEAVFARHHRLAEGVRSAIGAWGMKALCEDPSASSETLTAVVVPDHIKSGVVVSHARDRFWLSLGVGLGRLKHQVFRIGHVGSLNEIEVLGTLAAIEMTLAELGLSIEVGAGVRACQRSYLTTRSDKEVDPAASLNLASAAP
jgi:alanine-glyoxylate transaminase/serine-glyoxylate transaminase/serine-pyruvate transaminase